MHIIFDLDRTLFQTKFYELDQNKVKNNGSLYAQVIEILEQLTTTGHSLYICSSYSTEYIELVLQKINISKYFCETYSEKDDIIKVKVMQKLRMDKSRVIVIGDTSSVIEAAYRNNIPTIGVNYCNKEDISKALYTAENTLDIINLINQLEVFYHITHKLINKGKRIIGISGVDTSGKTMFSGKYSNFLEYIGIKSTVLHIDDFHNPSAIRCQGENEIEAYYKNAFNYNQVIDEILKPLIITGRIDKYILCLNLDTDNYDKLIHYKIDENMILLIEGVLLFREPLLEYLEGKIFLHINFDEVINRATLRDVPKYGEIFIQKYHNKYIPIQKRYLSEDNPEQISDIVIDNQNYLKPILVK